MPSTNNEQYVQPPISISNSVDSKDSSSSSSSSGSEESEKKINGTSSTQVKVAKKESNKPYLINVMLTFMNDTVLIKDVPTELTTNHKILLAPIIEHIKKIGKLVHFKDISYISFKDKMKVCVGIDPISSSYALPISDLDQSQDPLQVHLMVQDVQQVQSITINNQVYPMTSISNTKTINQVIKMSDKKSDLENESKATDKQCPEDDEDEEFTPCYEKKKPIALTQSAPKRKGRPPKSI
jgi:hypothetical protein